MKNLRAEKIRSVMKRNRRMKSPLREKEGRKHMTRLRRRESGVRTMKECARRAITENAEDRALDELMWNVMALFAGHAFRTAKGLSFTYSIRGNEMFVDRKDKSITRATVNLAARTALRLQRECGVVKGPKKLGTFGASYLYPVLIRIGVILPPKQVALPLDTLLGTRKT